MLRSLLFLLYILILFIKHSYAACSIICKTCDATVSTICTSCNTGRYLTSSSTCVLLCPTPTFGVNSTSTCETSCPNTNEFGDTTDRVCRTCYSTCATCNGPYVNTCLTCVAGKFLQTSNTCVSKCSYPYYADSNSKKCETTCTNSNEFAYVDPLDITIRICKVCQSPCLTCQTTDTTCKSCVAPYYLQSTSCVLACAAPLFGKNETRKCEASCNSNQFGDLNDNRICKACDPNCATCSGSATNCLSCAAPKFFELSTCVSQCSSPKWGNQATSSCVVSCVNSNEYGDPSDRVCKTCVASCKTCALSSTACTSCDSSYYFNSLASSCVVTCPSPYVNNGVTKQCDSPCPNNNQYFNTLTGACENCNSACDTCQNSASNCLTCSSLKYIYLNNCYDTCPQPLWGNTNTKACEASCPNSDEFGDTSNNRICAKCSSNCKTCTSTALTCTSCPTNYFLENISKICYQSCPDPLWGKTDTNTCEANCNSNEYGDTQDFRKCKSCSGACVTCSGTATTCTSCPNPQYLSSGSCIAACVYPFWGNSLRMTCDYSCPNANEYGDVNDNRKCKSCSLSCKTCIDSSTKCTSCSPPYYLTVSNTCDVSCIFPYWQNDNTRTCDYGCQIKNQYLDLSAGACKYCNLECKTCEGSASVCKSCDSPRFLYSTTCVTNCPEPTWGESLSGQCVYSCPNNHYFTDVKDVRMCKECSTNCKTCKYSPNNCTACSASMLMKFSNSDQAECVKSCGKGFYTFLDNSTCLACHPSCDTCSGFMENQCEVCIPHYFMTPSNRCYACDNACSECSGIPENCTSCSEEYKLVNTSPSSSTCIKFICGILCAKCIGENVCQICVGGNYYLENVSFNERECKEKTRVSWELSSLKSPKLFELRFSNYWPALMDTFGEKVSITISSIDPNFYSCNVINSHEDNRFFYINCTFTKNVTNESALFIKLKDYPPNSEKTSHFLEKDFIEVKLSNYSYCGKGSFWSESEGKCLAAAIVTPYIRLTNDAHVLIFGFDQPVPEELDNYISKNANILIPSINSSLYTASIAKYPGDKPFTYLINIQYQDQVKNNPLLFLNLNLTPLAQAEESFLLSTSTIQIAVMDYYSLSQETKSQVESAGSVAQTMSTAVDQAYIYSNTIDIGASFMIKGLVIVQIIQLMRFVEINYPPNVLEMFKTNLGKSPIFPEIDIEVEMGDGILDSVYYKNNLSIYILNNCGTFLLTFYGFVFVAIILKLAESLLGNLIRKKAIFVEIFGLLYDFFVWNFPITYLMVKFQCSSFLVVVALFHPTYNSIKGSFNLFFAVFSTFVLVAVPILSFIVIKRMRIIASVFSIKTNRVVTRESFSSPHHKSGRKPSNSPFSDSENDDKGNKPFGDATMSQLTFSPGQSPLKLDFQEPSNGERDGHMVQLNHKPDQTEGQSIGDSAATKNKSLTKNIKLEEENWLKEKETKTEKSLETGDVAISSKFQGDHHSQLEKEGIQPDPHAVPLFYLSNNARVFPLNENESSSPKLKKVEGDVKNGSITVANLSNRNGSSLKLTKNQVPGNNCTKLLRIFLLDSNEINFQILNEKKKRFSNYFENSKFKSTGNTMEKLKRNFYVLHRDYKKENRICHYFFLLEILRQVFVTLILLGLDNEPLIKATLVTGSTFLFLGIIILLKPYSRKKVFIQCTLIESLLCLASLGFLTLAILDKQGNKDFELRMNMGWLICYTNLIIIFFILGMMTFQILIFLWNFSRAIYFHLKLRKTNKIANRTIKL